MAKHNLKIRFIIVGIWNTIFGYLVYISLDSLFSWLFSKRYVAYMSALVFANIIAIINAYIFHKYMTFKSRIKGIGIIYEFLKFSLTYLVTFCLSLFLLPFFVEIMGIQPKIAGACVILCCTIISYLGHTRISFYKKPDDI
jgi:putative flippase GtrA